MHSNLDAQNCGCTQEKLPYFVGGISCTRFLALQAGRPHCIRKVYFFSILFGCFFDFGFVCLFFT